MEQRLELTADIEYLYRVRQERAVRGPKREKVFPGSRCRGVVCRGTREMDGMDGWISARDCSTICLSVCLWRDINLFPNYVFPMSMDDGVFCPVMAWPCGRREQQELFSFFFFFSFFSFSDWRRWGNP